MLKKLAKYGNSTTLVIDKAILELLNMDETTSVKLQTDGKSLIITPVLPTHDTQGVFSDALKALETMHPKREVSIEKMTEIKTNFSHIFAKHAEAVKAFSEKVSSNQEFKKAVSDLSGKYDPVSQAEEYLKELTKLRTNYFPEIAQLDREIALLGNKDKNE